MANAIHCVSYCVSVKNEETKVSATFKTLLHLNFSDKPKQSLVDIFVGLRLTRMGGGGSGSADFQHKCIASGKFKGPEILESYS